MSEHIKKGKNIIIGKSLGHKVKILKLYIWRNGTVENRNKITIRYGMRIQSKNRITKKQ